MKCKKCENNWDYLKDGELEVCYGCVGEMYMDGDGVIKDENKAIEYYLKGKEYGDTYAIYSLAWIYYSNKNDEQFIKYAEEGEANGSVSCINLLGHYYDDKNKGDVDII